MLPALESLDLGNNVIGDAGVAQLLPHLAALSALRKFNLLRTNIGDASAAALRAHLVTHS
jgi:hypothetical protein